MTQIQLQFGPGTTISGRYEIEKLLGAGGMGQVVKAIDRTLDNEPIALKMLYTHLVKDAVTFARFRNEVLVTRQLSHPNIVKIFDFGKASDEVYFISMEYVSGQSLGRMISDSQRKPIPFQEMLRILIDVGKGVGHAHAKGIVHRDLKPDNILVGENGDVKVTDFGLARTVHVDKGFTNTGEAVGTPYYMAPEQVRGDEVDGRCDIYALGIIMYELATGRRPFNDDSWFNLAAMHLREPLPPFANKENGVPKWYEKLAQRAAAKREEDRFESVEEFVEELEKHLDGQPVRIKRQSAIHSLYNKPIQRRNRFKERFGWTLITVLALLLMVIVIRFTPVIKVALGGVVLKTETATGADLSPMKSVIGTGNVVLNQSEYFKRVAEGDYPAVSVLLEAGVDPAIRNDMNETALIVASKKGRALVAELLLQHKADVDATDSSGKTALMHSLSTDNNSLIFSLIDAGAEVNMRDHEGRTALIYAVTNNKLSVITALRKKGALVNGADFEGLTALHYAVKNSNTPIVRVLLEDGDETADPNIADRNGNTPLFTAAANGSTDIVKMLISRGAKTNFTNQKGATPASVATKAVKEILSKYDTPASHSSGVKTVYGGESPTGKIAAQKVLKPGTSAGPESANSQPPAAGASAGGAKMTRLRAAGKPTGTWKVSQNTKISGIRVSVKNVGDYPATGISVSVIIPGGKKIKMAGPDSLERNGSTDYVLNEEQTATPGGELKAEIVCDNCYR